MERSIFFGFLLVSFFMTHLTKAQRTHEIRTQLSLYRYYGVSFYDYHESAEVRHNFEWDHLYKAQLIEIGYRYSVSPYLQLGVFMSHSLNAAMHLQQAESAVYYSSDGDSPQFAVLQAGTTIIDSRYSEYGFDLKFNHLFNSNKFRFYFLTGPSIQSIRNENRSGVSFDSEDEGLRQSILDTYLTSEKRFTLSYGLGMSLPLEKGWEISIVEVMGKYTPQKSDLIFIASNSLIIKTGVRYQFLK